MGPQRRRGVSDATEFPTSANIARMCRHRLLRKTGRPVAILALVALLFAQLAAGAHAAQHLGDRHKSDTTGVHTQICLVCASFAPVVSAHGGTAIALAVASLGFAEFVAAPEHALQAGRRHVAFRSRAPPR